MATIIRLGDPGTPPDAGKQLRDLYEESQLSLASPAASRALRNFTSPVFVRVAIASAIIAFIVYSKDSLLFAVSTAVVVVSVLLACSWVLLFLVARRLYLEHAVIEAFNNDFRDPVSFYDGSKGAHGVIALIDGKIVSMAFCSREEKDLTVVRLKHVATATEHQRKGLSKSVVSKIIEIARDEMRAKTVVLRTTPAQRPACVMYEKKFGFSVTKVERWNLLITVLTFEKKL